MANDASGRRYVALASQTGGVWFVVMIGEAGQPKFEVEQQARRKIEIEMQQEWVEGDEDLLTPLLDNVVVISVSAAERAFPDAWREYHLYLRQMALRVGKERS